MDKKHLLAKLRSRRIVQDFSEYSTALQQGADLNAVVNRVRASVSSRADVVPINFSDLGDRFLPLTSALSILNVKADDLFPIDDQNVQPDQSAEYFLELNRSSMSDEQVVAAKRAYLDDLKALKNQAPG